MVTRNLIFIDSRIADRKKIIDNLPSNSDWVVLASDQDGIEQISKALKAHNNLDSVQIISHGADSTLYLGASVLDRSNLQLYAAQLKTIGSSLTAGGDILLYGCDVVSSLGGQAFIAELARLTGADVAASADKTGSTSSANWVLEISTGDIKSTALNINGFNQTLGTFNGTDGNDTLNGAGEADIMDGKGGNDLIDGGANHDSIIGGSGNDTIDGSFGNDTLRGGSGNDSLRDDQGSNLLDGGDGSDSLWSQSLTGEHTLIGGAGYDNLNATGKKLNLSGGTDDDNLSASGSIWANGSTNYVQKGTATLSGGDGSDYLYASALSSAVLQGDEGDDSVSVSGIKNATLAGGDGVDNLQATFEYWALQNIGETLGTSYTLQGDSGDDILKASGYAYTWAGKVNLALEGGDGNDRLQVNLDGGSADVNRAIASASLAGGAGNDTLTGSGVLDLQMSGGAGRDTFVLTADQYKTVQLASVQFATQQPTSANGWNYGYEALTTAQASVITDFVAGNSGDLLDIKDLLQNAAIAYDGTNPFASGYLKLEQSGFDTLFKFDADGSAASVKDWVTVAVLKNVTATSLTSANFNPNHSPDGIGVAGQVLTGTVNRDTLVGGYGNDTINGNAGNDSLDGQAGADIVRGGTGNDTIDGSFGNDTLYGESGNDTLRDDQGSNLLDGGGGNDTLTTSSLTGQHTLVGGFGTDNLNGVGKALVLDGGDDDDNLSASGSIWANGSTNYVQKGTATLSGGDGSDYLYASALSSAVLQGDEGDDSVSVSGIKNATLAGGDGVDNLQATFEYWALQNIGETLGTSYTLQGDSGDDILKASGYAYTWAGKVNLALEGGDGNDRLQVNLDGGSADVNRAIASASLAGGAGNDTLTGSGVLDLQMSGGAGRDTFVLTADQYKTVQLASVQFATQQPTSANGWNYGYEALTTAQASVITDFVAGNSGDLLDIKDLLQNAAIAYDGTNPFASGYLKLEQSGFDTLFKFDADGSAASVKDWVTVAVLKNVTATSLTSANFNPNHSPDGIGVAGQVLTGTVNRDTLVGGYGNDTINGNAGNDSLDGQAGADIVRGGTGNDTIDGSFGNDTLYGESGNDTLRDDQGSNLLDGGGGNDTLTTSSLTGQHTLVGGFGTDNLNGVGKALVLDGGDDDDNLSASGSIWANGSTNYVQKGTATLSGGDGSDYLYASALSSAVLQGDEGDDSVSVSGIKNATLAGGDGVDNLQATFEYWALQNIGETLGTSYTLQGDSGDDILKASGYAYTWAGKVNLALEGGDGNDRLQVNLDGGSADVNRAIASASLAGGAGNDTLTGSGVLDLQMSGGAGRDTFVLTADQYKTVQLASVQFATQQPTSANGWNYGYEALTTAQASVITDFVAGNSGDLLDIKDLLQNAAIAYDGTNPFASGYLKLEQSGFDTLFKFDADGSAASVKDWVTVAVLKNVNAAELTASNFSPAFGTPNSDFLEGTPGADLLVGIQGNDTLTAGAGNDTLDGGTGNDSLEGGTGADSLSGGSGTDILNSGEGNDTVDAGTGDDQIFAGAGNDTYQGGEGEDIIFFGSDNSTINMGSGTASGSSEGLDNFNDIEAVDAGAGNDTVTGSTANDYIFGGAGNDAIDGGAGNDELTGGAGNDNLNGGDGVDEVSYSELISAVIVDLSVGTTTGSGSGSDTLESIENVVGSQAADSITGSSADNELEGGLGNDTLSGGAGNDVLFAGTGNDTVYGGEGADLIVGGDGAGDDRYDGGNGIDTVKYTSAISGIKVDLGKGTAGSISTATVDAAGIGNDVLVSVENIIAGNFADSITGSAANNRLEGLLGNDTLNGGTGADTMIGGDGSDTYHVDNVGDVVTETNIATAGGIDTVLSSLASYTLGANIETGRILTTGTASMAGNSLNNLIFAGAGNNVLDGGLGIDFLSYANGLVTGSTTGVTVNLSVTTAQITRGSGSDTVRNFENLEGSILADTLTGNTGANVLLGGAGNDTLSGGAGNDALIGGAGKDSLTGGTGSDLFDFNALSEMGITSTTWDIITDFKRTEGDKIDLSTIDANQGTTSNESFSGTFIGTSGNFTASGQLKFSSSGGKGFLHGNTDTDVDAEFVIELIGVTSLSSADIVL